MIRPVNLLTAAAIIVVCASVSACSTSRFGAAHTARAPQSVQSVNPVSSSSVQSQSLPPIGGVDGTITTADNSFPNSGDPALANQTSGADGSFVSLSDVNPGATLTPGGRDLSSPLTVTKLLGAWDVIAGADHCRLNLTQTTKTGTKRYRASTPGCAIASLGRVATWQLAGTQVQLYDDAGAIIGSLLLSGNRFLGTLAGGVAVSMAG